MKMRIAATLAFALFALSSVARADVAPEESEPVPQEDTGRSTEFRAMTGPATESVSGGTLLLSAYAVVWVLLFGYAIRLGAMSRETRGKLDELERALSKSESKEA